MSDTSGNLGRGGLLGGLFGRRASASPKTAETVDGLGIESFVEGGLFGRNQEQINQLVVEAYDRGLASRYRLAATMAGEMVDDDPSTRETINALRRADLERIDIAITYLDRSRAAGVELDDRQIVWGQADALAAAFEAAGRWTGIDFGVDRRLLELERVAFEAYEDRGVAVSVPTVRAAADWRHPYTEDPVDSGNEFRRPSENDRHAWRRANETIETYERSLISAGAIDTVVDGQMYPNWLLEVAAERAYEQGLRTRAALGTELGVQQLGDLMPPAEHRDIQARARIALETDVRVIETAARTLKRDARGELVGIREYLDALESTARWPRIQGEGPASLESARDRLHDALMSTSLPGTFRVGVSSPDAVREAVLRSGRTEMMYDETEAVRGFLEREVRLAASSAQVRPAPSAATSSTIDPSVLQEMAAGRAAATPTAASTSAERPVVQAAAGSVEGAAGEAAGAAAETPAQTASSADPQVWAGRLVRDPKLIFSEGRTLARFRIAVKESALDPETNKQVESTRYVSALTGGRLAENVSQSLAEGDAVIVTGTLRPGKPYRDRETGEPKNGESYISVKNIGPDLNRGPVSVARAPRASKGPQNGVAKVADTGPVAAPVPGPGVHTGLAHT